ncbi:uncharacterized protein [Misgurnus anguillicaudatus]|uniref:uncharacterized protein n=1 Tax=Misgurnus anguillicaudatus TaxID=75329 RepID=UPI003CCF069E
MSAHSKPGNPAVRPKRRPAYLQDYEVDFLSSCKSMPSSSQREQAVESSDDDNSSSHITASVRKPKRAHSSPVPFPPLSLTARDESFDTPHNPQQRTSQRRTPSLSCHASSLSQNRQPQSQVHAEFLTCGESGGYQSDRSDAGPVTLQRILEENSNLRETQQAIQGYLKRIETAKDELVQLLERACNLQRPSATPNTQSIHPSVTFHHGVQADDDDWPEPPPPVSCEEPRFVKMREITDQYNDKHKSISDTRVLPTLNSKLTSADRSMDFKHSSPREEWLRYGQFPAPQMSSQYVHDQTWDTPKYPYPGHPRMASHNISPTMASVDTTEKYYKGPSPTIPYFRNKDPSEFARLKMALDNLLPPDSTEMFKYQILVDHLKLEDACLIADSYLHSPTPYRDTMMALNERFGQPHQVALKRIATILDSPDISRNDPSSFEKFSLQVQSLVGLLKTLGQEGSIELQCGSHVARLLSKLPPERRADFRRHMLHLPGVTYSLMDLADWLKYESWCQSYDDQTSRMESRPKTESRVAQRSRRTTATLLTGSGNSSEAIVTYPVAKDEERAKSKLAVYCFYCQTSEHAFSQCPKIPTLTKDQLSEWIRTSRRCWRCGRAHQAAQCGLKKPCPVCQRKHLRILHEVNERPAIEASKTEACLVSSATQTLYLNKPTSSKKVLLKVVRVLLHHGDNTLDTFAILDDGSERTMLLTEAAQKLGLQGTPENLALRTIRHDVQTINGAAVSFHISPYTKPSKRYFISGAFTAPQLDLIDHSYPIPKLQKQYNHLAGLPLPCFERVKPLILVGADQTHIISPIEPVRLGPAGGPAAIRTKLGWTLQGPTSLLEHRLKPNQCLHICTSPCTAEVLKHVERLWQVDVLPFQNVKECTRSKQDREAIELLESKTVRVEVEGTRRYATPLLRKGDMPYLHATMEAVMPRLRSTERKLARDSQQAEAYSAEIQKLVQSGAIKRLSPEERDKDGETWFIPHHMVSHNGKNRVVFDCSFKFNGLSLNESLLAGPTLGSSLLGVLLRFREHAVAISADIKGMFHQVRLLPEDRPLLRFIWRDSKKGGAPDVFEWQVLPFGTTCSPCCATFALQRHVKEHSQPDEDVRFSVEQCFYVDNCLQSLPSKEDAKQLVDKLRGLLAEGGFELRQWASNVPAVVQHLPCEAKSDGLELWLAHEKKEVQESTLGLSWNCPSDVLTYRHRPIVHGAPTMRIIYRVLASQYDPLGYILPYTTRGKVLVQKLWSKQHGWDDTPLPQALVQSCNEWESELPFLPKISYSRAYLPASLDQVRAATDLHRYSDASESAYGAVAYLRTEDQLGKIHISFVLARSRVAPRRVLSVPRLELCAAVTGAQLANLLRKELTLPIRHTILWTDSTTVLSWIHSESCHFKVFVGTRVAEIHELTNLTAWRYVDSVQNPADDLTRGKTLNDLSKPNRWCQGPPFLFDPPENWPSNPTERTTIDRSELKKSAFCGVTTTKELIGSEHRTWTELMETTARELHGTAGEPGEPTAGTYQAAETYILQKIQDESFQEELQRLKSGKDLQRSSRLLTLAPEYDEASNLLRVGGRLRRAETLDPAVKHPVVLDAKHPAVKLLLQDYDKNLCHPGPDRVFAEVRRQYWVLRGREAIRSLQHACMECQRLRAKPSVPKMADLPLARLRLYKPAFYSTRVDCFGPFLIKIGRRVEKRWGILYKCLTTRAVHIDLLHSLDTDSFLMSLRRFIARRGSPVELLSDQGTNFRGGERELREAFQSMSHDLQKRLAPQKIAFHFNPPASPHFGGVGEREIRSIKMALSATIGAQSVSEEVLRTVLIEVENILNSKPLGYVSSNVADLDPVTPNLLLTGRLDSSLPAVIYPKEEGLSHRRWKHSQVLADHFWSSFICHYLPNLQVRHKWHHTGPDITQGTVVMIMDPQQPRAHWQVGMGVRVHPSQDSKVRSVDVQVEGKVYTRPVARLVVLPPIPEEDKEELQTPTVA